MVIGYFGQIKEGDRMVILKNVDNFTSIQKSKDVIEICSPLALFKITYFNHIRIFNNGARLSLGNRPDWLEHFFHKQYHNKGNFSKNYKQLTQGYILWKGAPDDGVLNDARSNFNIDNGITIVKKHELYIDLFLFASTPDNYQINNFYINNFDLMDHFINYYNNKSKNIIKLCKPDIPINYSESNISNSVEIVSYLDPNQIKKFYLETNVKSYRLEMKGRVLDISLREYQCIKLLMKGKSIKEISALLKLSPRTAYAYIDNVKNKLNVTTKSQLLTLVSNLL